MKVIFLVVFVFLIGIDISCIADGEPVRSRRRSLLPDDDGRRPPPASLNIECAGFNDHERCIQIGSFNIEHLDSSVPDSRKDKIARMINDNGLDVLGLQEIKNDGVLDQIISRLTGSSWAYEIGRTGYTQMVAILYNRALVSVSDVKELNSNNTDGRILNSRWRNLRHPLHAKITIRSNHQAFLLIVLHLKALSDSRSCQRRNNQVADLDSWLESLPAGTDLVMLGDYNDRVNEGVGNCASIDTLKLLEDDSDYIFLTDVAAGHFSSSNITWLSSGRYPSSIIDHVLINWELFPYIYTFTNNFKAKTINHGDRNGVSDHQPVFFWLGLH